MTTTKPHPRRRVDLLQFELDHHRISPLAFTVGRGIQDALERSHPSGSAWGPKVDTSHRSDAAAVAGFEAARASTRAMSRVSSIIGAADASLVRTILEGSTFAEVALAHGRINRRGIATIADRFRVSLEMMAEASVAHGAVSKAATDKHSTASDKINQRATAYLDA